VERCKSFWRIT